MVMKRNAMRKNLRQSILKSLGRYLAIVAIIALGSGMFVGLLMTKRDMVATGQKYMDEQNMFDLRLLNSYGWRRDQVDAVAQMDGVVDAEGMVYLDAVANVGQRADDSVYRFYSLPETVNRVSLRGGRMPQAPDECLADGFRNSDEILGTTVTISDTNDESTLEAFASRTYTVVGYVATPLYMDMNRGTTSVGNGSLANYFFIPLDGFDVDYYTEIDVTLEGDGQIYTEDYQNAMEDAADRLEPLLQPLAQERLEQVRQDAIQAYREGMVEYHQGVLRYHNGKAEAEKELEEGRDQLLDAGQQIRDNEHRIEEGEKQLAEAKQTLADSAQTMRDSRRALAEAKADAYAQLAEANSQLFENYKTVSASQREVDNGLLQLQTGLTQLTAGITQLEAGLSQIDSGLKQMDLLIGIMDTSISTAQTALDAAKQAPDADMETIAQLESKLEELRTKRDEYDAKREELKQQQEEYGAQLAQLQIQQAELEQQKSLLEGTKKQLDDAMAVIDEGFLQLQNQQTQVENQFASAEAQLESGEVQLESAQAQIAENEQKLADGRVELEKAKAELSESWKSYNRGKDEANRKLAETESELLDAKKKLDDALDTIRDMTDTRVYVMDRRSNLGYQSLDSSSDIVQGVSRVFPAFFLLIAALVCITTMTRMIEEERTQIGTLKALGYGNMAIIGKYLFYAGSGAVVGCGLGTVFGGILFPKIFWEAYKIMLYITPSVVIQFNWPLCSIVVLAYSAVMLFVTWFCCRRSLREEPAELIRPKAPEAGKKILLEYLPFWHRISFLNKVTIRNIVRYRQRLAMMLVGIGGCTALLMTGFGVRDSIVHIVDYQFEDITTYDMQVYFSEGQDADAQSAFRERLSDSVSDVLFYHQQSVELDSNSKTREIYLMAADERIQDFINFHSGMEPLPMPGENEVILTVGAANAMGIHVGDSISMRNSDMQEMKLTVSGIYDNYVYNYALVLPQTMEAQWGETPENQMALVCVPEGTDIHAVSAEIAGMDGVMNVSVNEDLAGMVGSMMDALDLVVVAIVFCAGLLAVIVLYNLTNININERIREIATIKVLGFNAKETAAYVFKENLSLTVLGALVGLPLGRLLLTFVISQIKVDFCWFKPRLTGVSCITALLLTLLAACVVDFIFYFRLDKINMAEALKSVE